MGYRQLARDEVATHAARNGLEMMRGLHRLIWILAVHLAVTLLSVSRADDKPQTIPPPYEVLRYDEDYRYLKDPTLRTDAWDRVKYISLASDRYLSIGGEARERYEFYHGE